MHHASALRRVRDILRFIQATKARERELQYKQFNESEGIWSREHDEYYLKDVL